MKITCGSHEIDLAKALPLTVGDLRGLKKRGVSYPATFDTRDPDHIIIFLHHFCTKVVPEVTEADVETLTLADALTALHFLIKPQEELDRPTSGESIASPTITDGVPPM